MSADLDSYFAALGSRADRLDPGTPEAARRRGNRRRHRFVAAWTTLTVMAAVGTGTLLLRDPEPAVPTGSFVPLTLVASVPLPPAGFDPSEPDPTSAWVQIVDGRAYVVRGGGGARTEFVRFEISDGDWAFSVEALPRWREVWQFTMVGDRALLVGHNVERDLPEAVVLDRWGARWEPPAGTCDVSVAYTAALVCYTRATQELAALDWATGSPLWSRTVDATRGLVPVRPGATSLPTSARGAWWTDQTDPRVLAMTPAGTVRVIDVRTGDTMSTIETPASYQLMAIGQTLYAVTDGDLLAYPLDGAAEPTVLHRDAALIYPCGNGLLCVHRVGSGARDDVIDTTTGDVVAHVPSNSYSVGGPFVSPDGALYDRTGVQVSPPSGHTPAWWIMPEHVLTLDDDGTVGVLSTLDGAWRQLGQVADVDIDRCAVDRHHLVCVVPDGARAWRFAA